MRRYWIHLRRSPQKTLIRVRRKKPQPLSAAEQACRAPEQLEAVHEGNLLIGSSAVDIWAIGALSFFLLSARWPHYHGDGREPKLEPKKAWDALSREAIEFVMACLVPQPRGRSTASQLELKEWMDSAHHAMDRLAHKGGASSAEEDVLHPHDMPLPHADDIICALGEAAAVSGLQRAALSALGKHLPKQDKEIQKLQQIFEVYDTDKTGTLTPEELIIGLEAAFGKIESSDDAAALLEHVNVDWKGRVNWHEFIAATMHTAGQLSEDLIGEAFAELDEDGNGVLTGAEVRHALNGGVDDDKDHTQDDAELLAKYDLDGDGFIDKHEFELMMKGEVDKNADAPVEQGAGLPGESTEKRRRPSFLSRALTKGASVASSKHKSLTHLIEVKMKKAEKKEKHALKRQASQASEHLDKANEHDHSDKANEHAREHGHGHGHKKKLQRGNSQAQEHHKHDDSEDHAFITGVKEERWMMIRKTMRS
eukprot:gnl/TRDRNA2_/TRDRNA2_140872_c0_seq1.p1 gnl/TRDRNA2_/TRDRNA2_140872_c0~~gnl/TRDRNA2_/TRDRNA2_140872_c0_seq1.p1  ORF type:complete len:480 (+),score=89.94 gnl/TRDRNA2_/TRDRNA2_140872_c0_seq1:80-1519(+)